MSDAEPRSMAPSRVGGPAMAPSILRTVPTRAPAPATSLASSISFALILGGTIGNLIDRLARSVVIDFIYFHHNSFSYPVFNVADSAITIGVAIILLFSVMGDHQSGEKGA